MIRNTEGANEQSRLSAVHEKNIRFGFGAQWNSYRPVESSINPIFIAFALCRRIETEWVRELELLRSETTEAPTE